jgi:hypothetical protein
LRVARVSGSPAAFQCRCGDAGEIRGGRTLPAHPGRPLPLGLPDEALARELSGFIEVLTGYRSRVLYRPATHAD